MDKDLDDLAYSEVQNNFGSDKADTLPKQCLDCSVRSACHGGCPIHRGNITNDVEAGLNYFCEGHHQFFTHTASYMRFMAEALKHNRPAADVMAWCKEKDAGFPALNFDGNDPCPFLAVINSRNAVDDKRTQGNRTDRLWELRGHENMHL